MPSPMHNKLNVSACKTLENEFADWIAVGGEVTVDVTLHGHEGAHPPGIEVSYTV